MAIPSLIIGAIEFDFSFVDPISQNGSVMEEDQSEEWSRFHLY